MLRKLGKIDSVLEKMAIDLGKVNDKYKNYSFGLVDNIDDKIYIYDALGHFNKNCLDFNDCMKDVTVAFRKLLKDKDLYLQYSESEQLIIKSCKLELLFKKDRGKVGLKSGDSIIILDKSYIPFFDELKQMDRVVWSDDQRYSLYEAPNVGVQQDVDRLIAKALEYNVGEYLIDKEVKM